MQGDYGCPLRPSEFTLLLSIEARSTFRISISTTASVKCKLRCVWVTLQGRYRLYSKAKYLVGTDLKAQFRY